ncbi:MAG: glycosyltransferase [Pseudomonadota bacterium]
MTARSTGGMTQGACPAIALQCEYLSSRGGGLPASVLPVAARLGGLKPHLVTFDPPPGGLTDAPVFQAKKARAPMRCDAHKALRFHGVQLVHTHGLWTGLSTAALNWAQRTGGPTLVSPHGMLDGWAMTRSRWKKRAAMALVERRHLNSATCVHALTEHERSTLRTLGVTAPIAVVPNGVSQPDPLALSPPAWLDRPTLLFLGRIHEKKGLLPLIAAWSKASGRLEGWQLAIAGWEDGPCDVRAEAARCEGRIIFPGPLYGDDKQAALTHASAFVLPSHSEGMPIAVLEAMAHGRPVLMSAACALPEAVDAGAAARISTDHDAMAVSLTQHLNDADWLGEAGKAGRKLVAERFDWDKIADLWRAIYLWALGEAPRPAAIDG